MVLMDGEGPPYGTMPGGYVYEVCGPVDPGIEPPPWLGFEAVGCPGMTGEELPPLGNDGMEPVSVGVTLPPAPSEGFEAALEVWLLL